MTVPSDPPERRNHSHGPCRKDSPSARWLAPRPGVGRRRGQRHGTVDVGGAWVGSRRRQRQRRPHDRRSGKGACPTRLRRASDGAVVVVGPERRRPRARRRRGTRQVTVEVDASATPSALLPLISETGSPTSPAPCCLQSRRT